MTDQTQTPKQDNSNTVTATQLVNKEIYDEFIKTLSLIQKSISLKDLKTLSMNFRLINKFRTSFKSEDFSYLNEIYIKPHFLLPSFRHDISIQSNFTILPELLDITKNLPEIIGFIFLILITKLYDMKNYDEAFKALEYLTTFFKQNENLTIQFLKARTYYYLSLICEKTGRMNQLISELYNVYRTACIQMDEITQVTLINCIIRYYLNNNAIEQARSFLSKIKFQENVSTNEDARYFYYLGRIEAIQMNYSEAFKYLNHSLRKAPEKCAQGFKNVVSKLIMIVQLLMGEIPQVKSIFNEKQMKMFHIFKPYLDLLKTVKNGNLDEFKNIINTYETEFERDKNLILVHRIRHVVIKAGLRKINLSYSRISIKDIVEKLKLENEKDAEYIIAKAIRDGVFLATINHDEGYIQSREIKDIYSTFQPQKSYQDRINFMNQIYNECQQAMKFSESAAKKKKEDKTEDLEDDDEMDRGMEEL